MATTAGLIESKVPRRERLDRHEVLERLCRLPGPEREVVELRMMLNGRHPTTAEMARLLALTPDQVQRIEERAWSRLLHPSSLPPR